MEDEKPPILEYQPGRPMPLRTRVVLALGTAGVAIAVGGIVYQPQQARPVPLPGSPVPLKPVWQPRPQSTSNPSATAATQPTEATP